ncbi:MAG: sensor domain-containing diguanylate cyclase, partial [Psychrosphaera sp.]|nr:sensor domain-containing diguanylate cyclase [Psychrosphaera sp.]
GVDYIGKPIKAREVHARVHPHLQSRALMKQQVVLNEKLQDLETRSRCIINEVTDAVVTVCPPGIIESANPAALSLFGYTEDEMLGKTFVELLAPKHHSDYAGHFLLQKHFLQEKRQVHSQEPSIRENAVEVTGLKHDGTTLPVDLTIKQLDLNYPLYLCFIHDLSIHKNILNELTRLSNLDGLTNIANRRCFDEEFEQDWHEAQSKQLPLSLIMADIDFFKQFNDTYGHQVGDDCLQKVAKTLENSVIRNADLVARFGGEEFVLILPNTDSKGACTIAQTILDNIKQLNIEHQTSAVADILTTSLGIATLTPVKNDVLSTLLGQADKALYQAKETGRDRWVLFKED